jgi:hypothetical protein
LKKAEHLADRHNSGDRSYERGSQLLIPENKLVRTSKCFGQMVEIKKEKARSSIILYLKCDDINSIVTSLKTVMTTFLS